MKAETEPETPKDGAWQVGADGAPFVTVGGRPVPLIEDGQGHWHPVVHRRTKTVMKRYPSNGVPDVNPVRQYAKAHGCSRREAERRLLALLTDAASE